MPALPPNYQATTDKNTKYIEPSKIPDGGTVTVRPCGTYDSGHLIAGWEYFSTSMKRTRRFVEFPDDYLEDIGLSYAGRTQNTGEKDTPKYFLSMLVLAKETDDFAILTVTQEKLRAKIERILAIDDYDYSGDSLAPFYMTISRTGVKKDTSYDAIPTLKPADAETVARWEEAKNGIWLPAMFDGADPFAGRSADAEAPAAASGKGKTKGQRPVAQDALGADMQPAGSMPGAW